jgi:uncharacterized heparinase superfamily protein
MRKNSFIAKTLRYYHTLKYLKLVQIYGQLKFRLRKPKINAVRLPIPTPATCTFTTPILKPVNMQTPNMLTLLNQQQDISSPKIWSDPALEKLWLYNLHYFDGLNTPALQDGNLLKRWIAENTPGQGNGWEPYPLSLRIVNWIKWLLARHNTDESILKSLALQARYLNKRLEIHLLGNHLLANAKALIFAGCFFQSSEAEKWLARGLKYFKKQLAAQVLADGGHFELSPMYHAIILEDLLDVLNILKTYAKPVPAAWQAGASNMLLWLRTMTHPDAEIAFFNDATLGIAPTLGDIQAYFMRLELPLPSSHSKPNLIHLTASGFARLQIDTAVVLVDVGEVGATYQPGHAHADTLSFEFSLGQQRLFVNSGTSTYASNLERARQRSTQAHNTLVVNESNSSDVWKSFRVAKRARVRNIKTNQAPDEVSISAEHDGYYPSFNIMHQRAWQLTHNKLVIQDTINGHNKHDLSLYFHLHPDIRVRAQDENNLEFYDHFNKALAVLSCTQRISVLESTYHPGFNLSVPNKKLVIATTTNLPTQINTLITWNL